MAEARIASLADVETLVELMHELYAESSFALDRGWAARSFTSLISSPQLEECRRRGCLSIHVEVGESNAAAIALYSRYGLRASTDGRLLFSGVLSPLGG